MGLWPGEGHFARRYDYGTEYARIMRELWALARPRRRTSVASAAPRSIKPVVNRLTSAPAVRTEIDQAPPMARKRFVVNEAYAKRFAIWLGLASVRTTSPRSSAARRRRCGSGVVRKSGLRRTRRWSKTDSNPRSPLAKVSTPAAEGEMPKRSKGTAS